MPAYDANRVPADEHGGTAARIIDLSNARKVRRLTNAQVIERVFRFLETGDVRHLPPALRGEADGIAAAVMAAQRGPAPRWPSGAARPDPGPGAPIGEVLRALTGDRADADSGLDDDGPGAA